MADTPTRVDERSDKGEIVAALNRLVSHIAAMDTTISGLSSSLTALSGTVTTLSGTVTTLSGNLTALQTQVNAIPAGMVKISDQTGTGLSGTLTFSAIPAGYRSLTLDIFGRSTTAATFASVQLQINSDATAGHYFTESLGAAATTVSGAETIGTTAALFIGLVTGATSPASAYGSSTVQIPEYAHTGVHKTVIAHVIAPLTYTSGNVQEFLDGGVWQNTAAISRLDLTLSAGNWTTDSRATLWGLPS